MNMRISLDELVGMIDEPNRSRARRFLAENDALLQIVPGSTGNHQCWAGGYLDHIAEVMNLGALLFDTFRATGRLSRLPADERFALSDVLLVMFLHDIEKPWKFVVHDGVLAMTERGRPAVYERYRSKAARADLAAAKIIEYGFELTPAHLHALKHVEGIRDCDYTPGNRVMSPLGALCHVCDLLSGRLFYDFPRLDGC